MKTLRLLIDIYRNYKRRKATMNELSSLSDYELQDIGLCRGDIYQTALQTDYKDAA